MTDRSTSRSVEDSLSALVAGVDQRIDTIRGRFDKRDIILWIYGAGGFGRKIARTVRARGGTIAGFVDRTMADKVIDGMPVLHPDALTLNGPAILLLGLFNPVHSWQGPLAWAAAKGFSDVMTPIDLTDVFPDLAAYWMVPRHELRAIIPALCRLSDMLADDASVRVLRQILSFRLTGNLAHHPVVAASEQYLPADLRSNDLAFPRPITFLDGGAFTGDTGLLLASNGVAFAEWIAFEPDLGNFAKLVETGAQLPQTRCTFFPMGLSDSNQDCSFDVQDSAASRLGGSATVRCVAIDSVLAGVRPDYVKLDIEGAEDAALRGMAATLESSRPRLAVCVYHKPGDLIDLAERIRSILPGARLYLRQHAETCFDTVLYACP
jgi:FkbM family methyltransferase